MHKQNTHGIYEEGCIPPPAVTNPQQQQQQQINTSNLTTSSSNSTLQNNLSNSLVSTQSSANGLMNQTIASVNSINPLLSSVYESNLTKEQLHQLQLEISKQRLLNLKNGNSIAQQQQTSFLEQSSTPASFNTSNTATTTTNTTNRHQQTPSPSNERSEKRAIQFTRY